MGQVTIYLNRDCERRLKQAAEEAGVPVSRWVAEVIEEKTRTDWPASIKELAGSWDEFPSAEALRDTSGSDAQREPL